MASYEYEALDNAGKTRSGVISADTPRLARQLLKEKRLVPLAISPAKARKSFSLKGDIDIRFGPAIGRADLSLITRQLATLIGASAPVEEALHTIAMQSEKKSVRNTLLDVRSRVTEGHKLSDALLVDRRSFPPLFRAMVAAGENTGNLGHVLERMADHLEKAQAIKSKLTAALVYPVALAITAIAVVFALMTFVVPKVVEQFDGLGAELPWLTRMLINLSAVIVGGWIYALIVLILVAAGFLWGLRQKPFRRRFDSFLLKVPFLGTLLREVYTARLARTLATLIASGTPVVEGLRASAKTIQNLVIQNAVIKAASAVEEGASLSSAMRKSGVFPPMIVYMAAVGESSGRLDIMLLSAAGHLEKAFETVTASILSLLEPAIIILMGGVVTVIVLAILMPILQLNTLALM